MGSLGGKDFEGLGGGSADQIGRRTPPCKPFRTSTIIGVLTAYKKSQVPGKGGSTAQAGTPFRWQP